MAGPLTMFVLSTMVAVASAYPTSPSTHMNAKHPAHVRHEDPFNGQSNAVMVFFVAMGFCLLIMTPVLWVLYAMRNEQREAERSHIPQPGLAKDLEGPAAMPTSQSAREHEVSTGTTKGRVAKLRDSITKVNGYVSEMRARVPSLPASVSEMRQQVSDKLWILRSRICSWFSRNKLPKTRISPVPHHASHKRFPSSIDLPIMRSRAWQELAEGTQPSLPGSLTGTSAAQTQASLVHYDHTASDWPLGPFKEVDIVDAAKHKV